MSSKYRNDKTLRRQKGTLDSPGAGLSVLGVRSRVQQGPSTEERSRTPSSTMFRLP